LPSVSQDLRLTDYELLAIQFHLVYGTQFQIVVNDVDTFEADTEILEVDLPKVKKRVLARQDVLTYRAI
jgi:hypothetical protein